MRGLGRARLYAEVRLYAGFLFYTTLLKHLNINIGRDGLDHKLLKI